jgi:hypothetical protein
MNTLERIAKLEKELAELKELVNLEIPRKENYEPRPGEICEFGTTDDYWLTAKFVEYDRDDVYPYVVEDNSKFMFCRQLNDPMVIQLIPYSAEEGVTPKHSNRVIVLQKNGVYDSGYIDDFVWNESCDKSLQIVGYFPI